MYKITIEKIDTVEYQTKQRRDTKRPATEKDLLGLGRYSSEEAQQKIDSGIVPTVEEYYYEPVTSTQDVTKKIFEQTVSDLDVPAVIGAVNALRPVIHDIK